MAKHIHGSEDVVEFHTGGDKVIRVHLSDEGDCVHVLTFGPKGGGLAITAKAGNHVEIRTKKQQHKVGDEIRNQR